MKIISPYTLLKTLARLPLSVLYVFSDFTAPFFYHIIRYRRKIVRKNLTLSFPEKTLPQIKRIEKEYYRFLADQIVETLKVLHISDEEMKRRVEVLNPETVNTSLGEGKNVVLFLGHYGNWEWVQEISRYFLPNAFQASIYHPLRSKTWDDVFIRLRSRWNAHIVSMKKAPRTLLDKQNFPWVCGFIADQWTWTQKPDNFTYFLNHKTWFIPGPEEIGDKVRADFFYLEMNRIKRGYYKITFHKLSPGEEKLPFPYTREFWKEFETTIRNNPPYWLWSHNRWKLT